MILKVYQWRFNTRCKRAEKSLINHWNTCKWLFQVGNGKRLTSVETMCFLIAFIYKMSKIGKNRCNNLLRINVYWTGTFQYVLSSLRTNFNSRIVFIRLIIIYTFIDNDDAWFILRVNNNFTTLHKFIVFYVFPVRNTKHDNTNFDIKKR